LFAESPFQGCSIVISLAKWTSSLEWKPGSGSENEAEESSRERTLEVFTTAGQSYSQADRQPTSVEVDLPAFHAVSRVATWLLLLGVRGILFSDGGYLFRNDPIAGVGLSLLKLYLGLDQGENRE
jgi:hypothetical protein